VGKGDGSFIRFNHMAEPTTEWYHDEEIEEVSGEKLKRKKGR
jgi:hypothetical protein